MMTRIPLTAALLLGFAFANATDEPRCENSQFRLDTNFASSAMHKCKFKSDGSVEVTIKPEDPKVSVIQPWYAFRVTAKRAGELKIRIRIPDGYSRYWPKQSRDGESWQRIDADAVKISNSKKNIDIFLAVDAEPVWISAQQILSLDWYAQWFEELAQHPDIVSAEIGQSVEGRPITLAKTANKAEAIVLLGRQHPSEITGALAMRDFVATVLADTKLARQFRERFTLVILPLMNPDGVANGHWRHNAGKTDLNRDWGKFKQPETNAVAALLAGMDKLEMRPRLMLDFHATKETDELLFYTQATDERTDPAEFDLNWFAAVRSRIPEFKFKHDPRPSAENPNTKGYFYRRYGIPSFTYELADEADVELLHATTPIFAEEMMRELLRTN